MTKTPVSLKPLEESATNWLHKLRTDVFARTEVIVIGIFFVLCVVNIVIITVSLKQLHLDIAGSVIHTLSNAITNGLSATTTSLLVVETVEELSNTNITIVVALSLIATILLGYVAARIALAPTRNGLAAQKKFISNIAHELRTPLSIIRANSEILLLQKGSKPDTVSLISSNVEELDRTSGIIDNLLTLNTFRHTGGMRFQSLDLTTIVRSSIEKLEKLAISKHITFDANLGNNLIVWGNKNGIEQIAMNLIKNAILYTPPKGNILVSTYSSPATITLEVKDSGVGIDPNDIGKVFEPFYRVDPSRSQNKGSGGLGLAIVSELVKFHHGKISIQSTPGVGTNIRIDFPHKRSTEHSDETDGEHISNSSVSLDFFKK